MHLRTHATHSPRRPGGTLHRSVRRGPNPNPNPNPTPNQAALFTARYAEALALLRAKAFKAADKGVPLEWFTWERIIIDECHESLVMGQAPYLVTSPSHLVITPRHESLVMGQARHLVATPCYLVITPSRWSWGRWPIVNRKESQ